MLVVFHMSLKTLVESDDGDATNDKILEAARFLDEAMHPWHQSPTFDLEQSGPAELKSCRLHLNPNNTRCLLKMAPNFSPKTIQIGAQTVQNDPKTVQNGSKTVQNGSKRSKTVQNSPNEKNGRFFFKHLHGGAVASRRRPPPRRLWPRRVQKSHLFE